MARDLDVAVVGATGLVGQAMVRILEERNFPVRRLIPLASQRSASPGLTLKCSSRETRLSNKRPSISSDHASTPTRGSRFAGLDSMIMTRVFASGLWEQARGRIIKKIVARR